MGDFIYDNSRAFDNYDQWKTASPYDDEEPEPEDREEGTVYDLAGLMEFFSADEARLLNKRIYKATDCGASISLLRRRSVEEVLHDSSEAYIGGLTMAGVSGTCSETQWVHNGAADAEWAKCTNDNVIGFTIQTIVEGSDAEVNSDLFTFPATEDEIQHWIDEMESEANYLWHEATDLEEDE